MPKPLSKGAKIGIGVGCGAAVLLGLGLGLGFGLSKGEEEEPAPAPAPAPAPTPKKITTWACDPRSGTQYMCSVKEGGPFTAETCNPADPTCKPCQCVMPVRTSDGACSCSYSDAAAADPAVPKYNSISQCAADATQKCGWKYGCDPDDPSDYKCSLMPEGEWGTKEECRCWYTPTDGGGGGDSSTMGWKCDVNSTSPSGCSYLPGGSFKTEEECRCFFAQGSTGPGCACVRTEMDLSASDSRAFHTMEQCKADAGVKCGWLYGCDDPSVAPPRCSLKQSGGKWTKSSDCACVPKWSCDPNSTYGSKCVQVADDKGQYLTQADCKCWSCDAASKGCAPVAAGKTGSYPLESNCNCVYAVGAPGPDCNCTYDPVAAGKLSEDMNFPNVATCGQDWHAKCGWKYKCATYGTILQCADMGGEYYLVDGSTDTLRLLTDEIAKTYDPNYKTNATYADCSFHNLTVGEPAVPKPA